MSKKTKIIDMGKYNIRTIKEKKDIIECYQKHGWDITNQKYAVSRSSLSEWLRRSKKEASIEKALARKPKRHTVREETVALVKKLHAQDPTLSPSQLKKRVSHVQHISRTTIWHIIKGR